MKKAKFWQKLFGTKQNNHIIGTKDAKGNRVTLERLREMEDMLQKKQTYLENCIQIQINTARKHGIKNKRAALMALKRKKRLEDELKRIDGTLTTIELQREALESARNNLQVLGAMQDAAKVLKNAHEHVTADKVLDIMDEVNEQNEFASEIADAISNPLGSDATVDESELEKELEQLEQAELDKALFQVNISEAEAEKTDKPFPIPNEIPVLPVRIDGAKVEGENPKKEEDPDEKELQELAQWST
ncbi:unnamed protein product [Orchesella dallaii]|uniref:Charged multivesicular body protein 4b n=1 Tax=Orchesella dallaii TaxID=48710 RepID=A0ABP1QD20_9HEXA